MISCLIATNVFFLTGQPLNGIALQNINWYKKLGLKTLPSVPCEMNEKIFTGLDVPMFIKKMNITGHQNKLIRRTVWYGKHDISLLAIWRISFMDFLRYAIAKNRSFHRIQDGRFDKKRPLDVWFLLFLIVFSILKIQK